MKLTALRIENFRNLERVELVPEVRFNVLSGANGQGKTNLLEALYLLGSLRSFRTTRTESLVRHGHERATLRATVVSELGTRHLEVALGGGPRLGRIDGKVVRSAAAFLSALRIVLFAPEDLLLLRGGADARRRFLDRAIFGTYPPYLAELTAYLRALKGRNALLRRGGNGTSDESLLAVYGQQVAAYGAVLILRRANFLEELETRFAHAVAQLTGDAHRAQLRYRPALAGELPTERWRPELDPTTSLLAARLRSREVRDRARGFTSVGPHLDDLEVLLDGHSARQFASQGQLRALVLALKVAEIEQVRAASSSPPIFLLDDVSSELDEQRNRQLFSHLERLDCQAWITTTHAAHIRIGRDRRDYDVAAGVVRSAARVNDERYYDVTHTAVGLDDESLKGP